MDPSESDASPLGQLLTCRPVSRAQERTRSTISRSVARVLLEVFDKFVLSPGPAGPEGFAGVEGDEGKSAGLRSSLPPARRQNRKGAGRRVRSRLCPLPCVASLNACCDVQDGRQFVPLLVMMNESWWEEMMMKGLQEREGEEENEWDEEDDNRSVRTLLVLGGEVDREQESAGEVGDRVDHTGWWEKV